MSEFLIRALLGGIGVALVAGPLGCFMVWRRMAYFGDTLAHAALLGVALGTVMNLPLNLAVTVVCVSLALLLVFLMRNQVLASDTLLGILAHSSLAIGLVALSFMKGVRLDLTAYLFGDLLAISRSDLIWIYGGGAVVLALLAWIWRPLLLITLDEALAQVEGLPVARLRMALMLLLSLVIAVAMKIVGVLLITALLIIPAATARRLADTPERMAFVASALGSVAVSAGLLMSWWSDAPAGPSVVVCAFVGFLLVYLWRPAPAAAST